MKKVKTIFMSLFLAASVACAACSCDMIGQSTDTVAPQSSIGTENSPAESIASSNGSFNFDEVCKNIVINGKQYTFPFSVEELGEGYSIGDISYSILDENDEYYSADTELYYNGTDIATIFFTGIETSEKENKNIDFSKRKIDHLSQSTLFNDIKDIYIYVCDIKVCDTANKVIDQLGNPTNQKNASANTGSYIYKKNNTKILTYYYDENIIEDIRISYNIHH